VDRTIDEASVADYDALLIPGGFINPDLLRQSAQARAFVRQFEAAGKPIATLCHGPWVLASAGLANGRSMTSWPGVRDDLVNAGATWLDQEVVRDANLLTSRGPQDMVPFVKALIPFFAGEESAVASSANATASAPQRESPPEVVLGAMKWLPRPSLRTAAVVGALAAVYVARSRADTNRANRARTGVSVR
jgi:protease I